MSVSTYFGLTESGKSYHVEKHVIPRWDRVIIFDNAHCFKDGEVINSPSKEHFTKAFRNYYGATPYRIIIRPGRNQNTEIVFNQTVSLAIALGRCLGERVHTESRIQFVCDEADFVCSAGYQSWQLKHLVNKGRHDNVDSHFIARLPTRIHTDIRANTSKIVTFRLQNAGEIPLFVDNFGRAVAKEIKRLDKYCRLEWKDNGEIAVFNANNKLVKKYHNGEVAML